MSRPFKVNIIVAALIPGHGIGLKGQLPWSLKNEMKYFRLLTTNTISPTFKNVVIMGRNTWESIPSRFRPLQNRLNIVLTRNANISVKNGAAVDDSVLVADSLKNGLDIIEKTGNIEEVFLIGGADLYNQCLASGLVDRIFLTEVKSLNGQIKTDVSIKIDPSQWIKQESQVLEKYLQDHGVNGFQLDENKEGELVYDFTLLERRNN